ncbi:Multidrug resistance protein homolog 49, partial [Gryllus bimaculatus]
MDASNDGVPSGHGDCLALSPLQLLGIYAHRALCRGHSPRGVRGGQAMELPLPAARVTSPNELGSRDTSTLDEARDLVGDLGNFLGFGDDRLCVRPMISRGCSAGQRVFPGNKLAVNNLSLNMYEGQITVLLGHNGAGKTTTISMITAGVTKVVDVPVNTKYLFTYKPCAPPCCVVFVQLKGLTGKELKDEIDLFLKLIQMEDKRNKQARTLSGGMKRKLAVCMALCGNSKVVFLDEPTSGMDPAARRALWDLLREEKAGRTLLLTTHMMDEADVLGDRIAIMAGGRLQCYGSPYFLKKRFSGGYHLVVVKGQRCNTGNVTK